MNETPTNNRANFFRALKKGFRSAYDHLGYVIFTNLAAFASTSLLIGLASYLIRNIHAYVFGIIVLFLAVIIYSTWALGIFYYANKEVFFEHPAVIDTWNGIKLLFKPAIKLLAVDIVITIILVGDFIFFVSMCRHSHLLVVLAIIFGYLTIVWLSVLMYHLPVLIAQTKMESGVGVKIVIKKSFLLMLDNIGFTFGFLIVNIIFALLCIIPGLIGIALLYLSSSAFILNCALRELYVKYEIIEDNSEGVAEDSWELPESKQKKNDQNE